MQYSVLADTYEKLEKEPGKLKKTDILSELLQKTPTDLLPKMVLLASGKIFPFYSDKKTGIASKMMIKAVSKAAGIPEKKIIQAFKEKGDLGLVAEEFIKEKKQEILLKKTLTVGLVYENLEKLASLTGTGSQDRKLDLIGELLTSAKPKEARYIVRSILQILRVGVAEGILRDAIAKTYQVDKKNVENAWFLNPNYGEIARIAKEGGNKALKKVDIEIGRPIVVMKGESTPSLESALEKYDNPILEYKYDGFRIQIHKKGNNFTLFTARQEDITSQFPDIVRVCKTSIKIRDCVLEGEVVGLNVKTGESLPFQDLSRRVQRKYDIELMIKKIPVVVYLFDLLYANNKNWLNQPYVKRRKKLEKSIKVIKGKIELSKSLTTKNLREAKKFFQQALKDKKEGLMVKNLDAKYQPGRRVGYWIKVKPTLEPLDLVIIGAKWGTGKRSQWLSSFVLGCREYPRSDRYLSCGKLGTGLTDKQFEDLTKRLKSLVMEERGREVRLKPKVVIEVGYEEIQKSPKYGSGYALRFPRLLRFRPEGDANELEKLERLFKQQFSSK